MSSELLSLDTAAKLARYDKTIEYLKEQIKQCDYQVNIIGNYQYICYWRAYEEILKLLEGQGRTKNILNEEVK